MTSIEAEYLLLKNSPYAVALFRVHVGKVSDNADSYPTFESITTLLSGEIGLKRQIIRRIAQGKWQNFCENCNKIRNVTCYAPVYQAPFFPQL